jgi:hypothetical protein
MKKVVFFALLAAVLVALAKLAAGQKEQWQGLTESQVRDKLDARIPNKVPADKRSEIADKVVDTMRDRGALADEPVAEEPTAAPEDGADDDAEASDDGPAEAAAS